MNTTNCKTKLSTITLILLFTISAILVVIPAGIAQEPLRVKTYPFVGVTPNPVGTNQPVLIHVGITCELPRTHDSWEGLSITIKRPDGQTDTISDIKTDATGGTGKMYTPTIAGTYEIQTHFPEQTMPANLRRYYSITIPEGSIMEASDSETIELEVTQEPRTYYSGHSLPQEYWTRPIDSQLWEWSSISGSWVTHLGSSEVRLAPYNDGPEAPHILWANPIQTGGLAGGEFDTHSYECGAAYQDKATPRIIIAGVFYTNRFEAQGGTNVDQEVVAINLHTGEELWSQPLLDTEGVSQRLAFGQQFYWDSYNYHGVFGYLWTTSGRSWHAYDAMTGRWVYSMENVPSGTTIYGPKGEIYRANVNVANGWMTLWNSSRVVSDEGSWRPHGNIYEDADERGLEWNITIPTGLPGSAQEILLGDKVIGIDVGPTEVSAWAFNLKSGKEGQLLYSNSWVPPSSWDEGAVSVALKGVSVDDGIFVVGVAETRQHWGLNLETCELAWGPTEPQHYLDYYQNLPSWIVDGKLFSGGMSGITYCYEVATGKLLWNYTMEDTYSEVTWSNNYPRRYPQGFIADGKYYSGYFEHSPIDPKPRDAPLFCLDVETGEEIWTISMSAASYRFTGLIGDSTIVVLDTYDNRIYGIGKGPSATTVSAAPKAIASGTSIVIEGIVNDVSPGTEDIALQMRFPNGVPAVADEDMSDWMEYIYRQFERPTDVTGVDVYVKIQDPNGDWYSETVTADSNGLFSMSWTPEIVGDYKVTAIFEGSESYYASQATTTFSVDTAANGAATEEVDLTSLEQGQSNMMTYILAILVLVIVALLIAIYSLLKKQK